MTWRLYHQVVHRTTTNLWPCQCITLLPTLVFKVSWLVSSSNWRRKWERQDQQSFPRAISRSSSLLAKNCVVLPFLVLHCIVALLCSRSKNFVWTLLYVSQQLLDLTGSILCTFSCHSWHKTYWSNLVLQLYMNVHSHRIWKYLSLPL